MAAGGGCRNINRGPAALALPACFKDGNCTLDDMVCTGVAFANLLIALSGAAFFATFVYGGALYVLSFMDTSYAGREESHGRRGGQDVYRAQFLDHRELFRLSDHWKTDMTQSWKRGVFLAAALAALAFGWSSRAWRLRRVMCKCSAKSDGHPV